MAKSFGEKLKYFWGFEGEEDDVMEATSDQSENSLSYNSYSPSSSQQPVYPVQSKNKVLNIHNNASMKIEVFQPKVFNEAVEIVDCLRSKKPVIINLEAIEPELARKIFDFLSGALCAIDGKAEKISRGIFLMAPNNVEVKGKIETETIAEHQEETIEDSLFRFKQ
ncbi:MULTISPECIES: cell division protein SepF [unclassified Fusibacter]|uniref:cell division protein SepF n=1 Tax=unclassified Fusibacter TaxID=2624464 RepID=UPI001012FC86|nr:MULTISPECIES: cell division protein SepF [unclassified Fusibacter]MCK8058027.1 cell division protein SepF [Fusibacter sp. A2]NPE20609.1 cell division protein SepF [Fusibacter sp. A1]RXV62816.1 cell division protein SepF [Fusibacter sp. A1]